MYAVLQPFYWNGHYVVRQAHWVGPNLWAFLFQESIVGEWETVFASNSREAMSIFKGES